MAAELNTVEDLFNDVLEGAEYEGQPALTWLKGGLCIDSKTEAMDKSALLELLSKAVLAVQILMTEQSKLVGEYQDHLNLKSYNQLSTSAFKLASDKYDVPLARIMHLAKIAKQYTELSTSEDFAKLMTMRMKFFLIMTMKHCLTWRQQCQ